ncbi:MAG TPA: peptidoglycan recognition family protein [Gemmatimonadaceae bacterium]|nr:peptidoglycan recognition family protein [Gemmatimonadaceae bacterium]
MIKGASCLVALGLAALSSGCASRGGPAPTRADVPIVGRAEWGARDPVLPMREHRIERITIHHTATRQDRTRSLTDKLRGLQAFSQRDDSLGDGRKKPAWADVPYHYYIAVDGTVGEARSWRYVGDSNTPYDPTGHLLIVVEGNFEDEQVTEAQMRALESLVTSFARRFKVPGERLGAHKDYASTRCPGKNLYAELPRLRALIDGTS